MPLRAQIPLSKSVNCQTCSFSTTSTPFLYQTKTLEAHSWDAKCKNPLRRPHKGHRTFCSTTRNSAQADDAPLQDPIPSKNTSDLLLSVPAKYRIGVPGQNRPKVKLPIPHGDTEISWQKRLIDRICSQLSRLPNDRYSDDERYRNYKRGSDAYEEIACLFESAIKEAERQEERMIEQMRINRRNYWLKPPPLRAIDVSHELGKMSRRALPAPVPRRGMIDASSNLAKVPDHALPPKEPLREIIDGSRNLDTSVPFKDTSSLVVDEFQVERRYHEENFMRELERAQTDDAVWSILETKVFSLIRTVEKRNEDDDKTDSKPATPKKVRRRKGRLEEDKSQPVSPEAEVEPTLKKPRRRKGQPEPKQTGPVPLEAEAEVTFQSPPPTSSLSLVTQPSPALISPDAISSIIQHNYGRYCLKALQVLRQEFPASLYALMILPTIKQLGSISYVLGATSGLYNELLHLKWTEYADIHGMADILEEMRNQGVQQDRITAAVIRVVECEREAQLNNNEDDDNAEEDWIIDEDEDEDQAEEEQRRRQQRHYTAAQPNNHNNTATAAWWKLRHIQEGWTRLTENFRAAERLTEKQRIRSAQDERDLREVEEAEAELDAKVSLSEAKEAELDAKASRSEAKEVDGNGSGNGNGGTWSFIRRVKAHAAERLTENQRLRSAEDERDFRGVEEAEAELDAKMSRSEVKEVDGNGNGNGNGNGGTRSFIRRVKGRRRAEVAIAGGGGLGSGMGRRNHRIPIF